MPQFIHNVADLIRRVLFLARPYGRAKLGAIFSLSLAQAFTTTNMAAAHSLQLESSWYARAALFTNQIPAFEAAPSVYKQRAYYTMFADATKNSRKYILLVTNTQDVLVFDLQDKIRADLMNVNPE